MRLISQDKKVDIPYKETVLIVEQSKRIFAYVNGYDLPAIMGHYSTIEKKALKVMEMIRKEYEPTCYNGLPIPNFGYYFHFSADDEVEI